MKRTPTLDLEGTRQYYISGGDDFQLEGTYDDACSAAMDSMDADDCETHADVYVKLCTITLKPKSFKIDID